VNWQPVATIAAPIIAFFVGFAFNRWLERRPRLLYFMPHAAAVQINPPNGPPFMAHTHSIVIRNAGKASANNVRLSHASLPANFTVFPSIGYSIVQLPGGGTDLVFPKIVPGQQLTITYLYFPPLVANQINTGCLSDEGFAKVITILWSPQLPLWQRAIAVGLMAAGLIGMLGLVAYSVYSAIHPAVGP
jgi:hypothetical protein